MWRIALLSLFPISAFAEVSDKAPTMAQLVTLALVTATVAVPVILWRVLPGLVATALAAVLASLNFDLLLDAHIGPQLVVEQGPVYAWVGYGSAAVVYIALIAAWAFRYLRGRRVAA
jgi:hypothetical protein